MSKEKVVITEENYKEIVLQKTIIICWGLLIGCFIIKLCGGNFFAIYCDNQKFVDFCNFIDKIKVSYILQFISFVASTYLIIKIANFNVDNMKLFYTICVMSFYWLFKTLLALNFANLGNVIYDIFDFLILISITFYCSKEQTLKTFRNSIIIVLIVYLFSFMSAITKCIGLRGCINSSFLVGFIFMIDYYIMLLLAYLYQKRRYLRNG